MRRVFITALLAAATLVAPASGRTPRQDSENVAAFARLYGAVRYFYPSDAAAGLDWDRFAVYGVQQARAASSAKALETTLQALFTPLGPGIEIGTRLRPQPDAKAETDASLIGWRYIGAAVAPPTRQSPYSAKRTHRSLFVAGRIDGFVSVMQAIPAAPLRGKTVRLRGQLRASARDATGSSAMWLRVDRQGGAQGFLDNMGNRRVRIPEWHEYVIEGPVADDAASVVVGVMASGSVTADADAIDLSVRGDDGAWTPVPIKDPGFEAAATDASAGWQRVGTSRGAQISRVTGEAPEGRQFLRFSPPTEASSNDELFDAPLVKGAHATIDLGSGLHALVPLTLSEAEAAAAGDGSSALSGLRAAIDRVAVAADPPDLDTRLAGVVVAWNVFRHFYPYWPESGVDWDARLQPQLEAAYAASTRDAQRDALRLLVADARDGHGTVVDGRRRTQPGRLPMQLGAIDDQLVVIASDAAADVPVGAVVTAIGGVPAARRLADAMGLASGTTQWKRTRALQEIVSCEPGAAIAVTIDTGSGPHPADVRCGAGRPPAEKRPGPVAELTPGVWYVDLTRAQMAQVTPVLEQLSRAAGVVFDVRGYPTDAGAGILPYLIDAPEHDRWMHVPKITGPGGQFTGWQDVGWDVTPQTPRLTGRIVFLTDGRAISYAESVMGYVADRKLGTIVGSTTAGTNGDVVMFPVPGDFNITFTGLRVTGHDGHTPHHLVGIKPDVAVAPTLAGIRQGRDEVLDAALAIVRGK